MKRVTITHGEMIYYEYKGSVNAPTIVFIHGLGVSAVHFYHLLVRFRLKGYRVLAMDLPSHGDSPELEIPLSADALYQSIVDWANKVAPKKFILVGNSLGGGLCLKYTFFQPHRVSHLIVNSPVGGFEEASDWEHVRTEITNESIEKTEKFLRKIFHSPPFYIPIITQFFHKNMRRPGIIYLVSTATVHDFIILDRQTQGIPPILFIWGKSERIFTTKSLKWFKDNMHAPVEFDEPEKLGHCAHMECPDWFSKRIETFVKKYP